MSYRIAADQIDILFQKPQSGENHLTSQYTMWIFGAVRLKTCFGFQNEKVFSWRLWLRYQLSHPAELVATNYEGASKTSDEQSGEDVIIKSCRFGSDQELRCFGRLFSFE
nr:hypothetical protein [Desulfobulbaceae bacterium]